ncbi:DUF2637 domain-containing protein [Streptomyces qinzhouensis]|uniref:DUF2637 domain-containing protein n=2 Tax=Streptomyces qinzhouensis TaxID=2599401 RepID=A0A5B8JMQ7_9ACTN|nr:DUF2637 domain-containing protein [Streptomyces qinzhouensis]
MQLTRTHRILIGVVVAGAVVIAAIGFAGSYAAVRDLAERKGFGDFALVFPIGIDAGICVLLALDLLLTWMRIPFPLLRQTAWLLTVATIAFNGAASWPDPLGVGMHAVIPVLFVVTVEAARHAIGRIADITADKHMEGVRLTRWLLSPVPTFKLWRRMKLWELRSYEQVIKLEQERLIYQARLQARYGRAWRRKAPVESLMPLRLAKYGVPLADTAAAGLAAAGVDPVLLPPAPTPQPQQPELAAAPAPVVALEKAAPAQEPHRRSRDGAREGGEAAGHLEAEYAEHVEPTEYAETPGAPEGPEADDAAEAAYREYQEYERQRYEEYVRFQEYQEYEEGGDGPNSPWFRQSPRHEHYEGGYNPAYDGQVPMPQQEQQPGAEPILVPAGPGGRTRILGDPDQRDEAEPTAVDEPQEDTADVEAFYEAAYPVFVAYAHDHGDYPKAEVLAIHLADVHGVAHPRSTALLRQAMPAFRQRMEADLEAEHIA